jgi:hypothetical protein
MEIMSTTIVSGQLSRTGALASQPSSRSKRWTITPRASCVLVQAEYLLHALRLANGRRFTQNKEWQLTICNYQLTFRRTPTGSTTSRMHPHSSLVLEVNGIYNAPGSIGPSDASSVESNAYPAVLEWVEALRRGEGYVAYNTCDLSY